ncbi:type II toxin-antitoxin system Phd/YefM family antitoxin [Candidatus Parcubacteria bacterium]|nr:MAG: type II toxin-antitoxin system Phd/YefM family antitoxin [Candidatus Parcubacteria bacterium]
MPNYKQMEKVLDLAAKTGDKVIVLSDNHEPYVVMAVKEYEALLHGPSSVKGLSEDELLSKINRDIAIWKASQEGLDDYSLEDFKVDSLRKDVKKDEKQDNGGKKDNVDKSEHLDEDRYYIEPVD